MADDTQSSRLTYLYKYILYIFSIIFIGGYFYGKMKSELISQCTNICEKKFNRNLPGCLSECLEECDYSLKDYLKGDSISFRYTGRIIIRKI